MWGAGSNSLESSKSAEAELVPVTEGSMSIIGTRDGDAPPGWKAASRMKGNLREPGGPIGSIERSTMGAPCEGQPKRGAEPRAGVGPAHSTKEALEGNEGVEGRGRPEGNQAQLSTTPINARAWIGRSSCFGRGHPRVWRLCVSLDQFRTATMRAEQRCTLPGAKKFRDGASGRRALCCNVAGGGDSGTPQRGDFCANNHGAGAEGKTG